MFNKALLLAIVIATAALVLAAIEFLPGTLYFPVVEYTTPAQIHFVMLRAGEPDRAACERSASQIAGAVRASCAECKTAKRCAPGLDAEQRRIFSREPLATPSLRSRDRKMIMTVSAAEPEIAMSVCRLVETQSASGPADKRLVCFATGAPR